MISAKLVVLSGCSGGGKSSLLDEMARRGYHVAPEPGRQVVKEELQAGGDGLPWINVARFVELCVLRGTQFYETASKQDTVTIFDRSILDNTTGLGRLGLPMPAHYVEALRVYRYSETVYLVPPWKELFRNDTERRHSFAEAEAEYDWLLKAYKENGYTTVVVPKASVPARADFMEDQIRMST
jgi:predicted ATPase